MGDTSKNAEVVSNNDDYSYTDAESDPALRNVKSIRNDLYLVIQSRRFQLAVIGLVILDCLLVIMEVLIDLRVVEMHADKTPAQVLHYMSIAILSLFLIEIALKLYVYKLEFFKHKWEVFDAIIVIVSFSLDVVFRDHYDGVNGMGLIIILRLWRVARILNGIVMSVKKQANRHLERERAKRERLEEDMIKIKDICEAQEREINLLQTLLRSNDIEIPKTSELDILERPTSVVFMEGRLSSPQNNDQEQTFTT